MMAIARMAVAILAGVGTARAELGLERIGQYLPLTRDVLAGAPIFAYFDVAAALRSPRYAAPPPAGALPGDGASPSSIGLLGMPQEVAPLPRVAAGLRQATGIDSLAMARVLVFGQPPNTVLVLSGTPAMAAPDALAAALGPRGFARAEENGWGVWHRFDDFQMNLRERQPADPFGGGFGRSARIAVRDGEVVGTAAWAPLRGVLAAIDGRAPSLAGTADLAAALHGIADAASGLGGAATRAAGFHVGHVGAVPLDPAVLLQGTPDQVRAALLERMRRQGKGEGLPPYALAVIAELSAGEHEGAAIALSYADQAAAQQAAGVLARRLEAPDQPGALERRNARVESRVVALPAPVDGRSAWASVLVVRYPIDRTMPAVFAQWLDAVFRRGFRLLALEAQ